MIRPFRVDIHQSVLDDLRHRIINARWPDEIAKSNWQYGASLAYLHEVCNYWTSHFNWTKTEETINSFPNFIGEIGACQVHFVHLKSIDENSIPLLLTHGWPGSFIEFFKMIPLLMAMKDPSFDLIIPSLPGFGFSQKVIEEGCNVRFVGSLFNKLMLELGYEKYGLQGGDFGAGVSTAIGLHHPQSVLGIHLNYIPGSFKPFVEFGNALTSEESEFEKNALKWFDNEGAYAHQHATKPLTLAYGLNDSPVGLCAWILEKFHAWSDCRGNLENCFTKDELLSNITLYWVTETIHSSIRLYHENSKAPFHFNKDDYVNAPVGIAKFPLEEPFPPRKYIERGYNVSHWTEFTEGGHFAAMEQPLLLAQDIHGFFGTLVGNGPRGRTNITY